jgi:hypothetical protein
MTQPSVGCIATGLLSSGLNITVTGGNHGQQADGIDNYLVEIADHRGRFKEEPKIVTKRNLSTDDLRAMIEHHHRNRNRSRRRY